MVHNHQQGDWSHSEGFSGPIYIKRGDKRAPLCAVWAKRAYPVSEVELRDAGWVPADQTESEATEWALRWKQRAERAEGSIDKKMALLHKAYQAINAAHRVLGLAPDWPPELSEAYEEIGDFLYPAATWSPGGRQDIFQEGDWSHTEGFSTDQPPPEPSPPSP